MRTKLLALALFILFAIKFLLLPLLDYQQQLHDELLVLRKNQHTTQALLNNKERYADRLKEVSSELNQKVTKFSLVRDKDTFQLSFQQSWQKKLENIQLTMETINWISDEYNEATGLHTSVTALRVKGTLSALAALHLELEKAAPAVEVQELQVNNSTGMQWDSETQMTFSLKAHYFSRTKP